MLRLYLLLFGVASFAVSSPISIAAVKHYRENGAATLTGRLEIQAFPGPPNYESVAHGDELETGLFIRLDQPITILSSEGRIQARILHLAGTLTKKDFQHGRKRAEARVSGSLFLRFNGHHRSRVLIEATSIEVRDGAKS
jgi:hypothetical protein